MIVILKILRYTGFLTIIMCDDKVFFRIELFQEYTFDDHYHAYIVPEQNVNRIKTPCFCVVHSNTIATRYSLQTLNNIIIIFHIEFIFIQHTIQKPTQLYILENLTIWNGMKLIINIQKSRKTCNHEKTIIPIQLSNQVLKRNQAIMLFPGSGRLFARWPSASTNQPTSSTVRQENV